MDEANGAAIPDPVELAIRQLLGDAVYQLAEGSPDGFWASNRLADCRAAIAAYADAERQAGWFAGLHAGQEQGRTNAAIEGAAGRTDADEARGLVGAAYAAAFDIGALTGRHGVHAAADAAEIYARHLAARAALLAALGVADDGGGAS